MRASATAAAGEEGTDCMKVARKHALALVFGILAVMAVFAYWQARQEVVLVEADKAQIRLMAQTILISLEQIWLSEGEARVRAVIERANQTVPEMELRLVSLTAPVGDPQRPPLNEEQFSAVAAGEVVQVMGTYPTGDALVAIYVAVSVAGRRPAALELVKSLKPAYTYLRTTHWAFAFATLAVVIVCGLIATSLDAWFIGRPLELLKEKLQRAGSGDFSRALLLRQHDEIGELAQEVNAMCDRIAEANRKLAEETEARVAALDQLRHTDRLATVGQLSAGVAHELGTPLNVVAARAQLIAASDLPRPEVAKHAHIIVEQSDRMTEIIHQLLDFSRRRSATLGLFSLERIVSRTLEMLSSAAERAHVQLDCEAAGAPVLARVDQNQIQQALTNVILNGIQAMPDGGHLRVHVGAQRIRPPADRDAPEDDYLCVTVTDEGKGIPPEQLARIFEPFFTTKGVGEGTGLGLAVAHGIVAEHGGWITVESTVGKGTRFSIFLPPPAGASAQDIEVAS
jgi:two-component system NtrC family sensor kinase